MKKRLIIDGSNALHRAFWVSQNGKKSFEDVYDVGPIYIFLKFLKSVVDRFKPDETWVAWDKRIKHPSTNFRKELLKDVYKQNRDTEKSEKVHEYHDKLVQWVESLGVYQLYPFVLEADDVMSWIAADNREGTNIIVTVDKDLLQLVSENTFYYNPVKKVLIDKTNFEELVGVKPENFLLYKAILGDVSDNIVGISGYGVQKSKKLSSLPVNDIKNKLTEQDWETLNLNLKIMDLSASYNLENGEVECYKNQLVKQLDSIKPNIKNFELLAENNGMYSISRKVGEWRQTFVTGNSLISLLAQL